MSDVENKAISILTEIIRSGHAPWLDFAFDDEMDAARKSATATAEFLRTLIQRLNKQ